MKSYWDNVTKIYEKQRERGIREYGQKLEENTGLTVEERINMIEEELVDTLMYLEHLKEMKVGELEEKEHEEKTCMDCEYCCKNELSKKYLCGYWKGENTGHIRKAEDGICDYFERKMSEKERIEKAKNTLERIRDCIVEIEAHKCLNKDCEDCKRMVDTHEHLRSLDIILRAVKNLEDEKNLTKEKTRENFSIEEAKRTEEKAIKWKCPYCRKKVKVLEK